MKPINCFVHGAIILGGLLIGLFLREGLKPTEQQFPSVASKSSMRRTAASQRGTVERIFSQDSGGDLRLTPEDSALLKSSLFHLELQDYPLALEELLAKNLEAHKFMRFANVLFLEWGKEAPQEALEALQRVPSETRGFLGGRVYLGWALTDVDAAFEHAERNSSRLQGEFMDGLMMLWSDFAAERPKQALERLAGLEKGDVNRVSIQDDIIRSIGYEHPDIALNWLMDHHEREPPKELLVSLITSWGRREPERAFRYVQNLPEDLQSPQLFKEMGATFRGNPEKALAMAGEVPEMYHDDFLGGVIASLASNKPLQAVEIGNALPEGQAKKTAYYRLASTWGYSDPVSAGEWLVTLPRTASRDSAIIGFSRSIKGQDSELAAEWVSDIDDRQSRGMHLSSVLYDWLKIDEAAARDWMEQQSSETIPQGMRERLLNDE